VNHARVFCFLLVAPCTTSRAPLAPRQLRRSSRWHATWWRVVSDLQTCSSTMVDERGPRSDRTLLGRAGNLAPSPGRRRSAPAGRLRGESTIVEHPGFANNTWQRARPV